MSGRILGSKGSSVGEKRCSDTDNPNYEGEEDTSGYFIQSVLGKLNFNVGGIFHTVLMESLYSTLPCSRIGRIMRAKTRKEVLRLCDKFDNNMEDNPTVYFDRNGSCFNTILDIYRSGLFHLCDSTCAIVRKDDLEFWDIDELLLEPCCALKYYPDIEVCINEKEGEVLRKEKELQKAIDENFGGHRLGRARKICWNMTEYPEAGRYAQVFAFSSLGIVFISTFTFILSTVEEFQVNTKTGKIEFPIGAQIIDVVDRACAVFFLLEYVLRLICCPRKLKFVTNGMNMVDLCAIIPFLITVILESMEDIAIIGKAGKIVRLVRVMRIMRIFKLVRHFAGLQSLIYTLKQAYKELGLLFLLVAVAILTVASLMYFTEKEASQWTFIDAFWYSMMTLTTVGYHLHPSTLPGKLTGGMCALLGIFILTLPIPIVVNSFASYYKNRLWRNEVAQKKSERMKVLKRMSICA